MPVAYQSLVQSLVQEIKDKEAIAHHVASAEGRKVGRLALPLILRKWKVRVAKKIFKGTVPPIPNPETEYMNKLVASHRAAYLVAYREENEKAHMKLKALLTYNRDWEVLEERFYARFPTSSQYISMARVREISRNVWEELLARETRSVDQTTSEGSEP